MAELPGLNNDHKSLEYGWDSENLLEFNKMLVRIKKIYENQIKCTISRSEIVTKQPDVGIQDSEIVTEQPDVDIEGFETGTGHLEDGDSKMQIDDSDIVYTEMVNANPQIKEINSCISQLKVSFYMFCIIYSLSYRGCA